MRRIVPSYEGAVACRLVDQEREVGLRDGVGRVGAQGIVDEGYFKAQVMRSFEVLVSGVGTDPVVARAYGLDCGDRSSSACRNINNLIESCTADSRTIGRACRVHSLGEGLERLLSEYDSHGCQCNVSDY